MEDLVVYEGVDLEGGEAGVGCCCGEEEECSWGLNVSFAFARGLGGLRRGANRRREVVFS